MKHLLFVFALFIFVPAFLSAQEKELVVTYKFDQKEASISKGEYLQAEQKEVKLFAYENQVISRKFIGMGYSVGVGETFDPKQKTLDSLFSGYTLVDYQKGEILSMVLGNKMLLKEPLNLFNWELKNETKSILDYSCTKATCSFRGRNYVAWLTREIPFKAAPWKFHGLPGIVLEVYSTDDFCKWTAISLSVKPRKKIIEFPSDGLDEINLEQYIDILKKNRQRSLETYEKMRIRYKDNPDIGIPDDPFKLPNTIEIFDLD